MNCCRCQRKLTKDEMELINTGLFRHSSGNMYINKTFLPDSTREIFGRKPKVYCQDCLKEKLMGYIFEKKKPELKIIIGGKR